MTISTEMAFQMMLKTMTMLMMTRAHQLTVAAALKVLTMLEADLDDHGLSLEITLSPTSSTNQSNGYNFSKLIRTYREF